MLVADHILALSSRQLPQRKLDTAITALMLLPSGLDVRLGRQGIRRQRYRIDHEFVELVLDTVRDKETQRAIVGSPAFSYLPKAAYRRAFFRFWKSRHGNAWRWTLGWSLSGFLHSNPREARLYIEPIWTIANDPDETVALAGLANTRYLGSALTLKGAEALVALTHHPSERAPAAFSNLGDLYKSVEELKPEVRAFLLSPSTIATLRSANPRDGRGKWSCYGICMLNMRKALQRIRRGRVPRALK